MTDKKYALCFLGALGLGLALRLLVIIQQGPDCHHQFSPGMDEVNYRELAVNLLDFHVYGAWSEGFWTSSSRAPGYPLILAAFYRLCGGREWAPQLLNLLCEALNIFLILVLGRQLYGRRAGMGAAFAYALFGPALVYVFFSTPEIFAVSLVLLVGLCLSFRKQYRLVVIPLILIFTFLIHTRPVFLLVTPFLAPCLYFSPLDGKWRLRLLKAVWPVGAVMILCLPWAWRNHQVHQAWVPVCTLACWHLVVNAEQNYELSINRATDFVYAPERRRYRESDFYRESMQLFRSEYWQAPLKILTGGTARLFYFWWVRAPLYRFYLPQAYFRLIEVGPGLFMPLPDFEGWFYVFVLAGAAAWISVRRNRGKRLKRWFSRSRSLLILGLAYAAAHILGIPLVQYRFIIEPLFLVLGIGLLQYAYAHQIKAPPLAQRYAYLPAIITIVILAMGALPLLYRSGWMPAPYRNAPGLDAGVLEDLRNSQWAHQGDLPGRPEVELEGVVKYRRNELSFPPGKAVAVPTVNGAVAKLYVRYQAADQPRGLGDVKLNFVGGNAPRNGQVVRIRGRAGTGRYKDIIITVEQWEPIVSFGQSGTKGDKWSGRAYSTFGNLWI